MNTTCAVAKLRPEPHFSIIYSSLRGSIPKQRPSAPICCCYPGCFFFQESLSWTFFKILYFLKSLKSLRKVIKIITITLFCRIRNKEKATLWISLSHEVLCKIVNFFTKGNYFVFIKYRYRSQFYFFRCEKSQNRAEGTQTRILLLMKFPFFKNDRIDFLFIMSNFASWEMLQHPFVS